jgi:FkbM family methyltransferase
MVIAFEPILSVYFELCSKVQQREFQRADIVPIPAGLSERVETTSISVPGNSFGYASLVEQPAWKEVLEGARLSAFECDFLTLDVILSTRKYPKPDFIKIDVEGAELNVLRGGAEAFKNGLRPLMLIELFAPWQKPFGYGPKDVFSYLSKWGYHFLFACPEGLIQHSSVFSDFPPEYENGYNVLAFVPSTHANRIRRLDSLMRGAGNVILPMTPPPIPNRQ